MIPVARPRHPASRLFLSARLLAALAALSVVAPPSAAGPLRERLRERLQADDASGGPLSDLGGGEALSCSDWSRRVARVQALAGAGLRGPAADLSDVAYGAGPREQLDVFVPHDRSHAGGAPLIVMVHGGGWCVGDKTMAGVTTHKVDRWTPHGFVFVSLNYPMVGDGADARAQAAAVARAVAFVQRHAADWGADPARVILMGHSAGAHLVSLVNADAELRRQAGVGPLLGTVSLDAGAIDVVRQMPVVYPFLKTRYREAFGTSEAGWLAASPYHRLGRDAAPWLGVCSTQRQDDPCGQARAYADRSVRLGLRAEVLPEAMNHGALNADLGLPGPYTQAVERFLAGLDPAVAARLGR